MKNKFHGYYQPTSEEFKDLWDNCIFTLDANVLLNLYRYTPNTRSEFIKILERVADRLWIPHQVALEYQHNRLSVISQQEKAYSEVIDDLQDASNLLESKLNEYRRHPYIDVQLIIEQTKKSFGAISKELEKKHKEHPDLLTQDDVRTRITDLFDDKVGSPYTLDKLAIIYLEGEKRYQANIPPGYMDAKEKKDNSKYGDLILWLQIMDHAKEKKCPVIFVCDDAKEDWWWVFSGKVNGPRPELIEEFTAYTQMQLYIYPSDRFMEFAKEHFKESIGKKAIIEVKNIRQDDELNRIKEAAANQVFEIQSSETEYLRSNWKRMIEESPPEFKKSNVLAIFRTGSIKPLSIVGDFVTLSCRQQFFKEKLEESENFKIVQIIISNFLGRPVSVKIVYEPPHRILPTVELSF
jgi:PIN like domain